MVNVALGRLCETMKRAPGPMVGLALLVLALCSLSGAEVFMMAMQTQGRRLQGADSSRGGRKPPPLPEDSAAPQSSLQGMPSRCRLPSSQLRSLKRCAPCQRLNGCLHLPSCQPWRR